MMASEARAYPERIWAGHLGGARRIWKPELSHESEKAFACEYVRADLSNGLLEALEWALAEIDGRTNYTELHQRDRCLERARATIAAATGQPGTPQTPQERFARWLEDGPKLAKAAGCYVGITVTDGQPTATEPARTDEDSGANKLP